MPCIGLPNPSLQRPGGWVLRSITQPSARNATMCACPLAAPELGFIAGSSSEQRIGSSRARLRLKVGVARFFSTQFLGIG